MAIRVECPSCRASFGVRDDFAGRQGRCPKCQAVIEVPGAPVKSAGPARGESPEVLERRRVAQAAAAELEQGDSEAYDVAGRLKRKVPVKVATRAKVAEGVAEAVDRTRRTVTPKQILAAFQGEIEPVVPTAMYRFWVAVVAGFMILLPLAYGGIILAVAFGLFYHATHHYTLLTSSSGHGDVRGPLFLYLAPLIAGVAIIAFMFKPLFARSMEGLAARALDPDTEPLIFAFVEGICRSVGAPAPVRIQVVNDVNAYAGLDGGLLGVFRNDLVLTIGLPLVAGLDLNQFAGVLAHEFGHFTQGAGMRVGYLIRWVNYWFQRVIFARDVWDEQLASWVSQGGRAGALVGGLAMVAIWITRRVLMVLMYAGHAASGFLSRQMEYDADRYEARMVGPVVFTRTEWRLRELGLAWQGALADVVSSWRQNRLPDNLPKLILANVPQIPPEVLAKVRKKAGQAKTGIFDTHPCDRDRIARAKAEATKGIFDLAGPATDVFRNFDSLARLVTLEFYREALGPQVSKDQLYPVAELVQTQAVEQEGYRAFQKFFLHAYSPSQPLPLPFDYPKPVADVDRARTALVEARKTMITTRDQSLAAWKRWREKFSEAVDAEFAGALVKAGVKIKASEFGLETASIRAASDMLDRAETACARAMAACEPFTSAAVRRLTTALSILESDAVVSRIPDGVTLREEARALYPCVAHLGSRVTGETPPVFRTSAALQKLLGLHQQGNNHENQALVQAIINTTGVLHSHLEGLRWKVGDMIEYPFEHADEEISLSKFVLAVVPPKQEIGLLIEAANDSVNRMKATYGRALGRLTYAAEEVEHALGLPPIPSEPPPAETEQAEA